MATLQEQFGVILRRTRLAAGLSQERLAELAGLHFTTVSLIERGKRAPTIVVLKKLADGLGTTMTELIGALESAAGDEQTKKTKRKSS